MQTQRYSEELLFGLALAAADNIGIVRFHELREKFGSTEAAVQRTFPEAAKQRRLLDNARATLAAATNCGATIIASHEAHYPAMLRTLRDPPPHIFTLGNTALFERAAVAIVGTRSATAYGLRTTRNIAAALASAGVVVVSGMARGIDAVAHEAALDVNGATIAILGTGVDVPYPARHRALHARIAQHGLILSELPCATRALPGSFPRRNRLIAALARAVIVTEAPVKSGALITANVANDIGRDVGMVPGNIDSPASEGSNRLLRDGATPILSLADALTLGGVSADAAAAGRPNAAELTEDAQLLWRALSASGPLSADALARAGGLEARRAGPALAALEIAGWVEIDHAGVIFAK